MKEEVRDKKVAALKATLELITERGFQGTPMSWIARRADIGVGTIYRYFPSKDDLISTLYMDIKSRLAKHVNRNYSKEIPVREGFKLCFGNIVSFYLENPAALIFVEQCENSPSIAAATHEEGSRLMGSVTDLFNRAAEQGLLKDLPLGTIKALFWGALISMVKLHLSGKKDLEDALLTDVFDAIWDMIKR